MVGKGRVKFEPRAGGVASSWEMSITSIRSGITYLATSPDRLPPESST